MNYLCLYVKLHSPKACAITGDFQNIPRAHKNYEMHLILRLLLSSLTGLTVVKSTGPRLCTTLLFLMLLSMIFWPGAEGVPQRGENEICLDALVIVHRHAGWRLITLLGLTVCCLRWHWLPLLNENAAYIDHWECTSPTYFFIFLLFSYLILIVHVWLSWISPKIIYFVYSLMFTDHLCCRKTVAARSLDKSFLMVRGRTGMTIDQDAQAVFSFGHVTYRVLKLCVTWSKDGYAGDSFGW